MQTEWRYGWSRKHQFSVTSFNLSDCQNLQQLWPLWPLSVNTLDHTLLLMAGKLTYDWPPATKSLVLWSTSRSEHAHMCMRCAHTNYKQMWLFWSLSKSLCRPFMSSGECPVKAFISSFRTDLCNKQLEAKKVRNCRETYMYKPWKKERSYWSKAKKLENCRKVLY